MVQSTTISWRGHSTGGSCLRLTIKLRANVVKHSHAILAFRLFRISKLYLHKSCYLIAMGNTKKKKQPRNVITTKSFMKKKIKVGKTLKKTNVTNTEFKSKSVVILDQFNDNTSEPVSQRGLTIRDLNTQIGHPSLPVRRDAVIGMCSSF